MVRRWSRQAAATRTLTLTLVLTAWGVLGPASTVSHAGHGEAHATIKTWAVGADETIVGDDPHETVDDLFGLTGHVATDENPLTLVTSMENTGGGNCGFLFWNPATNAFKSYEVTGGFQFAVDINRSEPAPEGSPLGTFGGGDAWATVNGNSGFSPYMNFRGSDNFRRWDLGSGDATGIRVNPENGKVYFGDFRGASGIFELNPATNEFKFWSTGNAIYNLVIAGPFVVATGVANVTNGGPPDQIIALDPATNELIRWDVPDGGFQSDITFGTPDSITKDADGNIWFTESASNQIGRLNPFTNVIDEYTKGGIYNPHSIASSGAGGATQSFFTEAGGEIDPGHISLITPSEATPTTTVVEPSVETVTPTASTATPVDFTVEPVMATIVPTTFDSPGIDPSGIVRFPIPPGTSEPTGMTPVVIENTVFGSMEGSDHVFQTTSEAITAPPPGACPPIIDGWMAYAEAFRGGVYVASGDLDGDGCKEVITGAGAGGSPTVRIFSGDGALLEEFLAYAAGFRGGVRVAAADVDGDGSDEVITGAGPGGGPHVKVFDVDSPAVEKFGFMAYAPAFSGGVFVAAGDLVPTENAEIVTGADAGGGPHVKVFTGDSGAEITGFFAYDPAFTGGVRVAVVGRSSDPKLATGAGPGGGPHVKIYAATGPGAIFDETLSIMAYNPAFRGGVYVGLGEVVPGSSGPELITGAGEGGGPHVKVFTANPGALLSEFMAYNPAFTGGVRVAAGDGNGDGNGEVITGAGLGGGPHVRQFE